ncbi:MAG: SRPBCC family protein [Steroidobacteraceae bacterium]
MEHSHTDWNQEGLAAHMPAANVGNVERVVTLAAGAALLGYAWRHRSRGLGLTSAGLIARGATGYCPAYAAIGVDHSDTRHALAGERGTHVRESISINASAEELYTFWRQLERLPEVMPHLERVEHIDFKISRWTAKALGGVPLTWMAEIINEVPFETIGWRTLPGESIQHAGSVQFKSLPGTHGTEVRVHLQYAPPGGKAGGWFAAMLGEDPARLTREGLQALKHRFERREP